MRQELTTLFTEIESSLSAPIEGNAILKLALVLEHNYVENISGLDYLKEIAPELINFRLNELEIKEILLRIQELILEGHPSTSELYWALGKANPSQSLEYLVATVQQTKEWNTESAYQAAIAIDNVVFIADSQLINQLKSSNIVEFLRKIIQWDDARLKEVTKRVLDSVSI